MSDGNMTASRGFVIGTAGHIDHGKTSLVYALTGMDTDRLAEEKKRGISIDLGFAHMKLPNGHDISFIDVPGHERFIKNMLAGAAGIQAVLLVIAADEAVKPQTREHFDICRLLGIEQGILALTKVDLATPEQLQTTREQARNLCAGSFLEGAELIPVSAKTGQGLDQLTTAIARLTEHLSPRDHTGLARLPVDRCFALKGFGAVVTGTLWNGVLRNGDNVQIHPSGQMARIRGLHVHGQAVTESNAGQRTAVNLSGVDAADIRRGFVLTHPDGLETTTSMDVAVDWLDPASIPAQRRRYLLHLGTAELNAALKVYPRSSHDTRTFARLWVSEPLLALPGDRFVLRGLSPAATVAGGTIVDPFPPVRLNRARSLQRVQALAVADRFTRIEFLVEESATGRKLSDLVRMIGRPSSEVKSLAWKNSKLLFAESAQRLISKLWIERRRSKLVEWLKEFHANHPTATGAPISAARLGLEPAVAALLFDGFSAIRIQGDTVALATHSVQFSREEQFALSKIEQAFRNGAFQPPAPIEVLRSAGMDPNKARNLIEMLIKNHRLVRVSEDLIFHADVIAHIRNSLAAHKGRKFSVPEFKSWTQISRKYAIPLLEYLDHQRVTRREGDNRIVL